MSTFFKEKFFKIHPNLALSLLSLTVIILSLSVTFIFPLKNFLSKAQTSNNFTFTATGDFGADGNFSAVLQVLNPVNTGANFSLALGDLSYGESVPETAWCDIIKNELGQMYPFEIVAGNHENNEPAGNNIDNFATCLPDRIGNISGRYSREYFFDYPVVNPLARILMISPNMSFSDESTYSYSSGSTHYNWVSNAIDTARTLGIKWIVVAMHEDCLTVGIKSCSIGTDLLNLLVNKKVDLIIEAHDHTYQRSKQFAHNATTCTAIPAGVYDPDCISDDGSDGMYVKENGPVMVIVATGGASLYDVNFADSEAPYFSTFMGANSNPSWGFLKVQVAENNLQAQFVPAVGVFTDSFTILESGAPLPTSTPTPTPTLPTFSVQVNASGNDAEENNASGSTNINSTDLEFVTDGTAVQTLGLRFTGVTIPQGAVINNAYLEFTVDEVQSEVTNLTFWGQASDNPLIFTTGARNVSLRPRTVSSIEWNNIEAWSAIGIKKQSPNLSSIVQEIIDRSGWVSGNSLAFIVGGLGHRTADSFDNSSTRAPKLVVSYQTSPTPTLDPNITPSPIPSVTPTPLPTPTLTVLPTPTITPTLAQTPTPTQIPATLNLSPVADTYVVSTKATTNFGTKTTLNVDGSPLAVTYMKFNLASLAGQNIASAKLRFKTNSDGSTATASIKSVGDTSWAETGMNYNTRPALSGLLATFTGPANTWIERDITSEVIARQGGLMSIGIDEVNSDGLFFYSRESTSANRPVIVVTFNN